MPASSDLHRPPLTRWSHIWRYVAILVISAVVWPTYAFAQWNEERWLFWIDITLGIVAFTIIHLRRRFPITIGVTTGLLAAMSSLAAGPATLAAVSVATTRRWSAVLVVGVAQYVGSEILVIVQPADEEIPFWISSAINFVAISAFMGWGMYIGSRRELLWTLRDRAEKAEAERDLRVGKARGDERARIAREMHDVLAHRISQVSMHAGALAFREDLDAGDLRTSASVIQTQANQARIDLRGGRGVRRDASTGELLDKPQPTYADLADLVEEALASGMHLEYEQSMPDSDDVPETAGRTLYRIAQEGLTNARKHAPATTVFLTLSGTPEDGIDVVIRNPLGFRKSAVEPRSGLGLIGLSERVELVGGHLEHREDGSMFVLHAWIPWVA
ncbi:MAG: histidine kinase [Nocardioides sp.]|nr:histidine kinase [Nocardioides sp.]